jgi:cell division protein FtsZ
MIGLGESDTENRAVEAVEKALNNPLLDVDIEGASGALVNVCGGTDVTIKECQEIVEAVSTKLNTEAKIIWGAQISKELGDIVRALLIVTGVKAPSAYTGEIFSTEKQKEIEKILGIEFV